MRRAQACAAGLLLGLALSATARAETVDAAPPAPKPGLGVSIGPLDFSLSGYFRAPLRLGFQDRCRPVMGADPCENGLMGARYNVHAPWLVDDDYFRSGFAYTRIQESDWSELYFRMGSKHLTAEVALMGSLFSDWARPLLDRQWGIAQANLTFRWGWEVLGSQINLTVRGGSFWDRFGWLENYDTYLFGRTHQMGGQARVELVRGGLSLWALGGFGAHLDAIENNQGLSLLGYLNLGAGWRDLLQANFYYLSTSTTDRRQLKELQDASMSVYGLDLRLSTALLGRMYLGGSIISADQATYLSPSIEVMHAFGGRGLTENYLGTENSQNGTGSLRNLAAEYHHSLRALLGRVAPDAQRALRGGDVQLRLFTMLSYTQSPQKTDDPLTNRDGRLQFKWGGQLDVTPLSWLMASLRYDRVVLDVQDDANSFRALTPRITVISRWLLGAQIFFQYTRYFYGERVLLRPGQISLETLPDQHALKLQAQIVF